MNCGFLNGDGVIYELGECTTIGKRQCGLIIDSNSVDDRHATIHYSKNENIFILQDLNSRNGTYVNGFRAYTVRLSPGDNIKFGFDHVLYEFGVGKVESSPTCPPIRRSIEVVEDFDPNPNNIFSEAIGTRATIRQPIHCRSKSFQNSPSSDVSPSEMTNQQLRQELRNMKNLLSDSTKKDQELKQQREIILELENKIDSIRCAKNRISQEFSTTNEIRQRLKEQVDFKDTIINDLTEKVKARDLRERESIEIERRASEQVMPPNKTEMVRASRDKRILEDLVTRLQRDSISKDEIISRQSVEISTVNDVLKSQSSGQEQAEVRALRKSLKDKESESEKLCAELTTTRLEMAKQRQKAAEYGQQCEILESQIRDFRTENADLERSGSVTKIELHKTLLNYEKFKEKIICSIASILTDCEEISDDVITREVARLCKVKEVYEEKVGLLTCEIDKLNNNEADFQHKITKLKESLTKDLAEYTESGSPISSQLDSLITKLESKHSLDHSVAWIRDSLISVLKFQSKTMHQIEDSIEMADITPFNPEKSIPENIHTLSTRLAETRARHEESLNKIEHLRNKFNEDISRLNVDGERQLRLQIEEAVDKTLTKEQEKKMLEINQIRQDEGEKMSRYSLEQANKVNELTLTIDKLNLTIHSREAELEAQRHRFSSLDESVYIYKANEDKLVDEIEILKTALEDANVARMKELADLRDYYEREARNYREQIKQYSVTICKQEENLTKLKQKKKMAKNEAKLAKMKSSGLAQEAENRQPLSVPPLPPRVMIEPPSIDIVELKNTISRLNEEIEILQSTCDEKETINTSLQREIHILKAQITDKKDDQPWSRELTEARSLLKIKDDEISILRRNNAVAQSSKNEREIEKLTQKLKNERQSLRRLEDSLNDKNQEMENLYQQLTESHDQRNMAIAQLEKYPKADELVAAGSLCKGERHQSIIDKQAEALSELRSRLKEFETFKMLPSPDSGLRQQTILLKRELAELKTREMFNNNALIKNSAASVVRKVSYRKPSQTAVPEPNPQIEDKFTASETLTLNFVGELTSLVGLSASVSLHSIVHMPPTQSESLLSERRQIFDMVVSKVSILNDRLQNKCNLLLQYEQDLSRMKVLEDLGTKTKKDIETYLHTIRRKTEEIEYMKESLIKYRELLNTEKRLNSAIKSKKTFHMENERAERNYRVHQCPPDDLLSKAENKCKILFGEIKKKDFIIAKQETELLENARKHNKIKTPGFKVEGSEDSYETYPVMSDDAVDDCEPTPS